MRHSRVIKMEKGKKMHFSNYSKKVKCNVLSQAKFALDGCNKAGKINNIIKIKNVKLLISQNKRATKVKELARAINKNMKKAAATHKTSEHIITVYIKNMDDLTIREVIQTIEKESHNIDGIILRQLRSSKRATKDITVQG